jgi:hypothetical protein
LFREQSLQFTAARTPHQTRAAQSRPRCAQYFMAHLNLQKLGQVVSIVVLILVGYHCFVNILNYVTAGEFASPLIPKTMLASMKSFYLRTSIVLVVGLAIEILLHKFLKYVLSILVGLITLVVVVYFPEVL